MNPREPTTPEAVALKMVCSVCGLGWETHGPDPTLEKCVELLKAELAKRPVYWSQQGNTIPFIQAGQARAA